MDKILFTGENGEKTELYVLETTRLQGVDYILASDVEVGDGECYILKDTSAENSEEAVYELVEDDTLLDMLAGIFAELLDDVDIAR